MCTACSRLGQTSCLPGGHKSTCESNVTFSILCPFLTERQGFPDSAEIQHRVLGLFQDFITDELDECMQRPSIHHAVLLLSDVSSRYMYISQSSKIHEELWIAFILGLYCLDDALSRSKFPISQPLYASTSTLFLHVLDQYRGFVKSIYVLPSECYPRTALFVIQCILWVISYEILSIALIALKVIRWIAQSICIPSPKIV